ncbi:hypothetical protein Tco_0508118 [Tanacetum coccineum]
MPYMAHQDEYGARGNSDDGATTIDGAGRMGAVGIYGVEVVGDTCLLGISVSDSESSEHKKGETTCATDTEGGDSPMDQPPMMNEYQARAP